MWRLAKSLETLRSQVNEAYPKRSKASDGTIGDTSHAASASDHNPNAEGVVCALDLTNDPKNGFDAHKVADTLINDRHPDLKYIISNNRIAGVWTNWKWEKYNGINPHSSHIHISVGVGPDGQSQPPYDDTTKWKIGEIMEKTAYKYLIEGALNRKVTKEDEKKHLGKDPNDVIIDVVKWAKANNRSYGQTVDRLNKRISELEKDAKVLPAGKYIFK